MNIRKSLGSAALGCALGLAAAAGAMPPSAEPTVVALAGGKMQRTSVKQVRFDDLDLSSAAGRERLDRRVRLAAGDVCDASNVSNTGTAYDYLRCYKGAMQAARTQMDQRIAMSGGGVAVGAR